jgi:RIO kinase 2
MVRNVAPLVADLDPEDFYLLSGVEHGMRFSEWVDRGKLPGFAGLDEEETDYRLDRALDRDLVERRTIQYEGYKLTFEGYDALALHAFAERDTVAGVGAPLGVGKESDVYEAQAGPGVERRGDGDGVEYADDGKEGGGDGDADDADGDEGGGDHGGEESGEESDGDGRPLALKFHREGYTNFREVRRERDYTADKEHVSWMYTARKAAEREHEALETLYPEVSVPEPIDHNRHAIVMEKMPGQELARTSLDDDQAVDVLDLVLRELAAAYDRGFVHADVSEYNVFVSERGVTVFDWPQAVTTDHENARELVERDVANLVGYVQRKYPRAVPDVDVSAVADAMAGGGFESVERHRGA